MAAWSAATIDDIAAEGLEPLLRAIPEPIDLLLIGCGPTFRTEPAGLRQALRAMGFVLEWMDTGAACRTYNILLGEDRRVAAALVAV